MFTLSNPTNARGLKTGLERNLAEMIYYAHQVRSLSAKKRKKKEKKKRKWAEGGEEAIKQPRPLPAAAAAALGW